MNRVPASTIRTGDQIAIYSGRRREPKLGRVTMVLPGVEMLIKTTAGEVRVPPATMLDVPERTDKTAY